MKNIKLVLLFSLLFGVAASHAKSEKATPAKRGPASEELVKAYLNLADALAKERIKGNVCESEAYEGEVLNLVSKAQYVDGFKKSFITDDTKTVLDYNIEFKAIMGNFNDDGSSASYATALSHSKFHSPPMGVFGSTEEILFNSDYTFLISKKTWDDNAENYLGIKETKGTWKVDVRTKKGQRVVSVILTYKLANGKDKTIAYRLAADYRGGYRSWYFYSNGSPMENGFHWIRYYNEDVGECDA